MRTCCALAWSLCAVGCNPLPRESSVEAAITAEITRGVEATRIKDIDAYMAQIPEQGVIHNAAGEVNTSDQLRANTLRAWSIIARTIAIAVTIDSLSLRSDTATVFTSQRWERLMYQRDGVTLDTVITTQKHGRYGRELRWRGATSAPMNSGVL